MLVIRYEGERICSIETDITSLVGTEVCCINDDPDPITDPADLHSLQETTGDISEVAYSWDRVEPLKIEVPPRREWEKGSDAALDHTPGPWKAQPNLDLYGTYVVDMAVKEQEDWVNAGLEISDEESERRQLLSNTHDDNNARLISCAPEFYAILREFVADVRAAYGKDLDLLSEEWPDLRITFEKAVNALTVAEAK